MSRPKLLARPIYKHDGPGPHKSGSSQDVHKPGGKKKAAKKKAAKKKPAKSLVKDQIAPKKGGRTKYNEGRLDGETLMVENPKGRGQDVKDPNRRFTGIWAEYAKGKRPRQVEEIRRARDAWDDQQRFGLWVKNADRGKTSSGKDVRAGGEKRGNAEDRYNRSTWMLSTFGDGRTAPCGHCGAKLTRSTMEQDRIIPGASYARPNMLPSCGLDNKRRTNNPAWTYKVKKMYYDQQSDAPEEPTYRSGPMMQMQEPESPERPSYAELERLLDKARYEGRAEAERRRPHLRIYRSTTIEADGDAGDVERLTESVEGAESSAGEVGKSDERVDFTIDIPISKVDEEKRLVFGWASAATDKHGKVLVDKQDDFILPDDVEKAAYDYVMTSRDGGVMHIQKGVATLVESFVTHPEKLEKMGLAPDAVPAGRWWVGYKVHDDAAWKGVKDGVFKMFSVHGRGRRTKVEDEEFTKIAGGK